MAVMYSNVPTGCCVLLGVMNMVRAGLDLASRDTVILVADWGSPGRILNVSLQHMNFSTVPTKLTLRPVAVDYDSDRETLYWTDVLKHQIRSTDIRTGEDNVLAQLRKESTPDGLALDAGERLLFYTDAGRNLVVKLSLLTQWSETIVQYSLSEPRAITTHPEKRKIYWTDWGFRPKIETANYDGSSRTTLVSTELTWPNGLTIDTHKSRMYWCDAKRNRIESVLLNGLDRRLVLSEPAAHYFDIFYHRGLLYFTDWANQHSLFHIPVCGGKKTYLKSGGFRHLAGLHVFSSSKSEKKYIEPDCADQCSRCKDESTCDPLTGRCGAGCVQGWTGVRCNTVDHVTTVKPSRKTNEATNIVTTKSTKGIHVADYVTTVKTTRITNKATEMVTTKSSRSINDADSGGVSPTSGTTAESTPATTRKKNQISIQKTSGVDSVTSFRRGQIDYHVEGKHGKNATENRDALNKTGIFQDLTPAAAKEGSQNSNHNTFGLTAYVALGVVSLLLLLATATLVVIYIKRQKKAKKEYSNLEDVRPQCFNNNTYALMSGDSSVYLVPVEESTKQDADNYYEDICELKSFMGKA